MWQALPLQVVRVGPEMVKRVRLLSVGLKSVAMCIYWFKMALVQAWCMCEDKSWLCEFCYKEKSRDIVGQAQGW